MLWLAIESATLVASVAVGTGTKIRAEMTSQVALTHSERLLPMIDQVLNLAGVQLKDIEGIVVAAGPGSFTGLRIGLATAKGLAHARSCPLYAVSTLESLAWQQPSGIVVPMLDARREQVYTAIYRRNESGLINILEPTAMPLKELLQAHLSAGEEVRFVGEAASLYQEQITNQVGNALFADQLHNGPRAASLAFVALGSKREPVSIEELRPTYIRASQAERKLGGK